MSETIERPLRIEAGTVAVAFNGEPIFGMSGDDSGNVLMPPERDEVMATKAMLEKALRLVDDWMEGANFQGQAAPPLRVVATKDP